MIYEILPTCGKIVGVYIDTQRCGFQYLMSALQQFLKGYFEMAVSASLGN